MRYDLYGRKPANHGRVPSKALITGITDKDTALIFSLIMLMRKENRSPTVILALLYILT